MTDNNKTIELTVRPGDDEGSKARRAIRRLALRATGRPETIFEMTKMETPDLLSAMAPAAAAPIEIPAPAAEIQFNQPFSISPKLREWAKTVKDILDERKIAIDTAWVLVTSNQAAHCLIFATQLGDLTVAYEDVSQTMPKFKGYCRLEPFVKALWDQKAASMAVVGNALSYVVDGRRHEISLETKVKGGIAVVDVPVTGYSPTEHLGVAIKEAASFVEKQIDEKGLHQVQIVRTPKDPGTWDVIGASTRGFYRRTIRAPGITSSRYMHVPVSIALDDNLQILCGKSRTWLYSVGNGLIIGLDNTNDILDMLNLEEYLSAQPQRVEWVHDEYQAIRRAISQLRMIPIEFSEISCLSLKPEKRGLQIRGGERTLSVPCSAISGPEIFLDEELLGNAMTVRGITGFDFDPADVQTKPVRFSGPQVVVAVMPCRAVSI